MNRIVGCTVCRSLISTSYLRSMLNVVQMMSVVDGGGGNVVAVGGFGLLETGVGLLKFVVFVCMLSWFPCCDVGFSKGRVPVADSEDRLILLLGGETGFATPWWLLCCPRPYAPLVMNALFRECEPSI